MSFALAGCHLLISHEVRESLDGGSSDRARLDGAPELGADRGPPDQGPRLPVGLEGLPAECGAPFFPETPTAASASRILFVSPAGTDQNLALTPPCPEAFPCRQIGALFALSTSDSTICDGTPGQHLTHLRPGDLVSVAAGSYDAFEIRQACGQAQKPIAVVARGPVEIRGAFVPTSQGSAWTSAIFIERSRHIVLDGLTLRPPAGSMVRGISMISATQIVIRGCDLGGFKTAVHAAYARDVVVDAGVLHDGNFAQVLEGGAERFVITRNLIRDNKGAALALAPEDIWGNPLAEFTATGAAACLLVDGNQLLGNLGSASLWLGSLRLSVIRNNLIQGSASTAIAVRKTATAGPADILLANNTIDVAAGTGVAVEVGELSGVVRLFNNLLHNRSSLPALVLRSASDAQWLESNHNSLYAAGAAPVLVGVVPTSLVEWRSGGRDLKSIDRPLEELAVKPSTSSSFDYHLTASSVARGAGVNLGSELGTTIEGKLRGSLIDLGCY